jgi:hypothetical protein
MAARRGAAQGRDRHPRARPRLAGRLPGGPGRRRGGAGGQRQDRCWPGSSWPPGRPAASPGVFVTLEESADDLRRNLATPRLRHRRVGAVRVLVLRGRVASLRRAPRRGAAGALRHPAGPDRARDGPHRCDPGGHRLVRSAGFDRDLGVSRVPAARPALRAATARRDGADDRRDRPRRRRALAGQGRRAVRRRLRRAAAQLARGGVPPAHRRGPQDARRRAPRGQFAFTVVPGEGVVVLPISVQGLDQGSTGQPGHLRATSSSTRSAAAASSATRSCSCPARPAPGRRCW